MHTVTSRHNPLFKALTALKKDRDLMLLEGRRLVSDAMSRGIPPRMIAATEGFASSHRLTLPPDIILSDTLFMGISETETPQGILAFFEIPWATLDDVKDMDRVVILDGLQDPGNVGTIVRTAEAFGIPGMIILEGTASPFSPKAVRASMGSCLGIRIVRGAAHELKRIPHRIVALAGQGRMRLSPGIFVPRTAICLGQEATGIRRDVLDMADETVFIPMKGRTESLNVAVAAGIVMACAAGILS